MLLAGLLGLAIVLVASALLMWARRPPETYEPGQAIEGITSTLARDIPPDYPKIEFQNVAASAGVRFKHFHGRRSTQLPEDMGSGAAWGDYDNDGHPDLFLCNIAGPLTMDANEAADSPGASRLYRNQGDGSFTDVTEEVGLTDRTVGMGAAWGDFDNDGYLDLVVTSYGEIHLYRNNRDGTFSTQTEAAGLSGVSGFWAGASWGDYDQDEDLDLYVCGYVHYTFHPEDASRGTLQYQATVPYTLNPSSYPPERNLLFRNIGDATFTEIAAEVGVDNLQGRSLNATWTDFDEDGWLDLYVANDVSDNVMYHNLGDGSFEEVSHAAWVADYRGAMGLAVGDWDGDGDQDIFTSHWIAQENALYSNLKIAFGASSVDPGEMRFMDVADMVGLGQIALDFIGWGSVFFDYDNDGRPDLFVANGSTFQDEENPERLVPMRDLLFWNGGEQRGFFEVGQVSGEPFQLETVSRGAAAADYDGDGDMDVVVIQYDGEVRLLRNEGGNRNNWLRVEPRARRGNRFAVGAKVRIEVGDSVQSAHIGSQPSYLSQSPYEAHFGLGRAERADRVVVLFPSGKRVEQSDVAANQRLVVWEAEP